MHRKLILENFFDDLDDVQINTDDVKISSGIDFNDPKWPVFIIFYFDGTDNKSGLNVKKMGKYLKAKIQSSPIIEECSDLYITDNSEELTEPNINCLLSRFNGNMSQFKEFGFWLCVGVIPNERGTIKHAYELVVGILSQAQNFIDNVLETELSCDSITLMNHDDRQYMCSWDVDINSKKVRFFTVFDVIRILLPNLDEMTAFKQFRSYLEKKKIYKTAETLYTETLRNSNRGYRFYDVLINDGGRVSVNKTQWNKFTKYVKELVVVFDNLTGEVCHTYSLRRGFADRAPFVYNFINDCLSNGMTITVKVVLFIRGKDKKYIRFLYYIDDVLFDNNTYKSIVFSERTYSEITYMLAASLYHLTILNIEPYEILESIKGICSMDEKDYNLTKTHLESYINGTKDVPNI